MKGAMMKIILVSDQVSINDRIVGIIARVCGKRPVSTFQAPGIENSKIARALQGSRLDAVICRSSSVFPGGSLVSLDQLLSVLTNEANHEGIMILILRGADLGSTFRSAALQHNLTFKEVKDHAFLFLLDLEKMKAHTID